MIYCNRGQVEFSGVTKFRAERYFNADGDDVTTILPGDAITIRPLLPHGDAILAIVAGVDSDGWIRPVMPRVKWYDDFTSDSVAFYKGQGE